MSDIIARLRDDERSESAICRQAADEIERLLAEVAGLRGVVIGLVAILEILRTDSMGRKYLCVQSRGGQMVHIADAIAAARKGAA